MENATGPAGAAASTGKRDAAAATPSKAPLAPLNGPVPQASPPSHFIAAGVAPVLGPGASGGAVQHGREASAEACSTRHTDIEPLDAACEAAAQAAGEPGTQYPDIDDADLELPGCSPAGAQGESPRSGGPRPAEEAEPGTQYPDIEGEALPGVGPDDTEAAPATQYPDIEGGALLDAADPGPSRPAEETQLPADDDEEYEIPGYVPPESEPQQRSAGQQDEADHELDMFLADEAPDEDDYAMPPPDLPSDLEDDFGPAPMAADGAAAGGSSPTAAPEAGKEGWEAEHEPVPFRRDWLVRSPPPRSPSPILPLVPRRPALHAGESSAAPAVEQPSRPELLPRKMAGSLDGLIMPVTSSEGERVYCHVEGEPEEAAPLAAASGASRPARGQTLLSRPIGELLDEVESEAYKRSLAASAAAARQAAGDGGPAPEGCLWVDRYRPRSFLDLLSDEPTNRAVLRWLKAWDPCVFGGAAPPPQPEQRVLLLCGPPGLGKTTLAHVVAQHCGYRPVEINASDTRTGAALQTAIADAAGSQPVLGARRPACIVVDEIDGVVGGAEGRSAVTTLLKLTQPAPAKPAPEAAGPFAKKKRKGPRPLCRPLIAICNDPWVPALRPLRQAATVLQFKPIQSSKLVVRLRVIAAREGLSVDRQALVQLAERSECDMRCCLNTLQFLARAGRRVRSADVTGASIGRKDMAKGAFSVWNQLLTTRAANKVQAAAESTSLAALLDDHGDQELIVAGVHENMLDLAYLDTHMQRTAGLCEQLQAADALLTSARRSMDFRRLAFLPAALLAMRAVVAGHERPKLRWPRRQAEAAREQAANAALLHSWRLDVDRVLFAGLSAAAAVQEVVPALLHVACRPLRAVAHHLFTPAEAAAMAETVCLLNAYGFTFDMAAPEPPPGAPPRLALKPEIHRLAAFEGVKPSYRSLPTAVRQMIVHAAELERLQRKAQSGQEATPSGRQRAASGGPRSAGGTSSSQQQQRPASGGTRLMFSVAERAAEAGSQPTGPPKGKVRKRNWLEQMRDQQERKRRQKRMAGLPAKQAAGGAGEAAGAPAGEGAQPAAEPAAAAGPMEAEQ